MINYKKDQVKNHITWHNKNTKCRHCKKNLRASNVTRHEKVCIKGKVMRKRKERQCIVCLQWFKGGKSARHFREPCKGKIKRQVRTEKCEKCKEIISKSNMGKHEETCGSKYVIRRTYLKRKIDENHVTKKKIYIQVRGALPPG